MNDEQMEGCLLIVSLIWGVAVLLLLFYIAYQVS